MLQICRDILPQSTLTYVAFRLACAETLKLVECAQHIPPEQIAPYGYLTEVPFLTNVAPQVQISLLADTWSKHLSPERQEANLLDESVVYAVCETAARIVERTPSFVAAYLQDGPRRVEVAVNRRLAVEIRQLHLQLSNEGDFLVISQFQDLEPDESRRLKREFRLSDGYLQPMFEVLGRWRVPPNMPRKMTGLLAGEEIKALSEMLGLSATRK
jgi:hypothetical protein